MNILAHLHLAKLAQSSIIGNAVADFVKGDPYSKYPNDIANGIMMHRRLDKLIDNLPAVKQAKSFFIAKHQRVAPITLDIVWDHFLSKHWADYCTTESVTEFNESIKSIIQPFSSQFSDEFNEFITAMCRGNWLVNYADLAFIQRALKGMANRRPKLALLSDTFTDITQNYEKLEAIFKSFYPELMQLAKQKKL
ncbi:ACP phosphodiesterase [Orbaceae bacterium ac157xtp]